MSVIRDIRVIGVTRVTRDIIEFTKITTNILSEWDDKIIRINCSEVRVDSKVLSVNSSVVKN
jgi:hypothetical protein